MPGVIYNLGGPAVLRGHELAAVASEPLGKTIAFVVIAEEQRGAAFDGTIANFNDGAGKPVSINYAIGKRPVFVGGNEGGRGDIAMMRWSKDRDGPSFQLLINHDDEAREFAYSESDSYSLEAAGKYGFHVLSMKTDWNTVIKP
ncbi:hypothetical protein [Neorhizobium galegae]|uniref:hypothetical protein n=1 Tax=Neorhizobium galegae TaxID=399 RepID=UPI0006223394|nr:hypothetical protein [Neorhizobium galegae]MCQ1805089.1 hypothetical protein [Neorhizobium galegae]CDZ55851.1 Hypothetical protein NGAL_HAMBI2566_03940 [Neorhizobium galegae bv. orientalis]